MSQQLSAGTVIRIADFSVRPAGKEKWHICVCPQRRWFLRINFRPLWQPCVPIRVADNPWLKHDSYVELRQVCQFLQSEVDNALRGPQPLVGQIGHTTAAVLVTEVRLAVTLAEEEKDVIAANISRC